MPAKDQANYQVDLTKATLEQRSAVITGQLLHDLGRPDALYRVEVRPLWDGHLARLMQILKAALVVTWEL